jgi:hypothetical protein
MLMLFESWDFHKNSSIGFTFTWPGLDKPKVAWRQGVLYYVPADMIPKHECSAVHTVERPTLLYLTILTKLISHTIMMVTWTQMRISMRNQHQKAGVNRTHGCD